MADGKVATERAGDVTVLRADRPPVNAIDLPFARKLVATLEETIARGDCGALVITGREGSFSAGLDLKAVPSYGREEQREMVEAINRITYAIYGAPLPVVAAVNGHAIAGGLCIALCADYRIAARGAFKLGLTEVRAGVPFPFGAIAVVKAELGPAVARRTALFAENVAPEEALAAGIVDEICAPEELERRAIDRATSLAKLPREAFARTKRQLRGETLQAMRRIVEEHSDPMLESWLGDGTAGAAAKILTR